MNGDGVRVDRTVASWRNESGRCFSSMSTSLMLETADNVLAMPVRRFEPELCGGLEERRDFVWKKEERSRLVK